MKRSILVMFLVSLIPIPAPAQRTPAAASLSGIVVREGTGEPLAGAQAILTPVTASQPANSTPVVSGKSDSLIPGSSIAILSGSTSTQRVPPVSTDRDGKFV